MKKILLAITITVVFLVLQAYGLEITSPENITYNSTEIQLLITSNETLSNLSYSVDNGSNVFACSNCSEFNETLNLTQGNHSIYAQGLLDNSTLNDSVSFLIILPIIPQEDFNFNVDVLSPQNITYYTKQIMINITTNISVEKIEYRIDNGTVILACENCSEFNRIINLSEGRHNLTAYATLNNNTKSDMVWFEIDILPTEFNVDVLSPQNITYYAKQIMINITTNVSVEKIEYRIDNGSVILACENCSEFNRTINLSEGRHNLTAYATLNNNTKSDLVWFKINIPPKEFSIEIIKPEMKTYNTHNIPLVILANATLDNMSLKLDSEFEILCENCSIYNKSLYFEDGVYAIYVKGTLDNISKEDSVVIIVNTEFNVTPPDDVPRFDKGFQKLPQAVANGELSDYELAEIIRNNKLNPGVLNRLIKTGMLENESIQAIIDTQFKPPGIFKKLLLSVGVIKETSSSLLYQEYDLDEESETKIAQTKSLPRKENNEIKEKNQKKTQTLEQNENQEQEEITQKSNSQEKKKSSNSNNADKVSQGQEKKNSEESNNIKIPPGQQKKQTENSEENDNSKKIPPGQQKKMNK